MNTAVKKLAMFARDLLDLEEGTEIFAGRKGFRRDDFTSNQVVVDSLGMARRLDRSSKFDGVHETTAYAQKWEAPCTINFYGDGAFELAEQFSLLIATETGWDLARSIGISVYEASGLIDVKMLTGEQYSERFQLLLNVQYTSTVTVATGRIDTVVFDDVITDYLDDLVSSGGIIHDSDVIDDDTVISDDTIMGDGETGATTYLDSDVISDSTILDDGDIMGG